MFSVLKFFGGVRIINCSFVVSIICRLEEELLVRLLLFGAG